jgi:4-amino-4-deoxy-L-arabinose transferase-like glycosyltransferase
LILKDIVNLFFMAEFQKQEMKMSENYKVATGKHIIVTLMILSIAIIAFLTYVDILDNFFTGTDTLTLIVASRVDRFHDVVKIFAQPLMAGTKFAEYNLFYRPIASLSYSVDYHIWRLNPFGYHLTDLTLHMLVSILVFVVMWFLTGGKKVVSWLSAVIFTMHPILVESVPAIDRRQDIIAALFLTLSLVFFLNHLSATKRRKNWLLLLSFLTYVLGLLSKEIAILLPFLICAYQLSFLFAVGDGAQSFRSRTFQSMKICLPYFALTAIYIAWRLYVLGNMGGYPFQRAAISTTDIIMYYIDTFRIYFLDLLYPVAMFGTVPRNLAQAGSLAVLILLFVFLFVNKEVVLMYVWQSGRWTALSAFRVLSSAIAALSLIGILCYPLISSLVDELVRQVYYAQRLPFLTTAMKNRSSKPLAYYFDRVEVLSLTVLLFLLSIYVVGLLLIRGLNNQKRFSANNDVRRIVVFLLIWLLLPLGIFLAIRVFDHRSMYIAVIPFSAILSITLIEGLQIVLRRLARKGTPSGHWLPFTAAGPFIVATALFVYLSYFSPMLRTYGEWEALGKVYSVILNKLSETVARLPNHTTIHIYNLPQQIASYQTRIPRVKSFGNLLDHSIKSWLDLTHPDNRIEVVVEKQSILSTYPRDLDLEIKAERNNNSVVIIKPYY